ncbi:MAG: ATP-binding cassette domain-containing protein [Clostridia bacterium]|nr:ATP-binding cassette domain-containing protein [Clostridia bacterium]
MKNTPSLLSVVRLKKYFPLAKSSLFAKKRQYLRANEDVTLDIVEGETFGLVGESGCGKSTFGRTLLQLYRPTQGEVIYYGKSLEEIAPRYAFRFLKNAEKYRADYAKEPSLDGNAHEPEFFAAARILGGLLALSEGDCKRGAALYAEYLRRPSEVLLHRFTEFKQAAEKSEGFAELEAQTGGVDLARLTTDELRSLRKDLQIVFQDPYSSLDPRMTVGQIIEEGVATHKFYKRGTPQMRAYILDIMKRCGLQEHMLHRYPHQFSGGQRQRICIARALALKPRFVVCDECVSALDASIQSQILNLLSELKEREGLTYLFISHDLSVVRYISDRIGVMYLGDIVEQGNAEEVFENPRHPYTIALMSAVPTVGKREGERILLKGHMPSPVTPPSGCKFHTRCFMACEKCRQGKVPVVEVEKGHFVACHFAEKSTAEKQKLARKGEEV